MNPNPEISIPTPEPEETFASGPHRSHAGRSVPWPGEVSLTENRRRSPAFASVLSLVPGLGQIYVGYYSLGFVHAFVVAGLLALLVANPLTGLLPFLVVLFVFFMLYNVVDAGRRAALYNQALAGVPGLELPQDLQLPRFGGSIFGGGAFIVSGLILLLNTVFGMSLEWLGAWWPVAPMIFGSWLIWRAVAERRPQRSS